MIHSWTHWDDDEAYIEKIFSDLDKIIDLDFARTYTREDASIQIYKISETANLDGSMGHAQLIPSKDPNLADIEIIWKYFDSSLSENNRVTDYKNGISMYEQNSFTIIHEIGHALGLGHPGGDGYASFTDANETVMSYNYKQTNKPWTFSYADLETLKLIWGEENDSISTSRKENNYFNSTGLAVSSSERQNLNESSELTDLTNMRFLRKHSDEGFVDKLTGDFIYYGTKDFENISNENEQLTSIKKFISEEDFFPRNIDTDLEEYKNFISLANKTDGIYKEIFSVSGYQGDANDFDFEDNFDEYISLLDLNKSEIL